MKNLKLLILFLLSFMVMTGANADASKPGMIILKPSTSDFKIVLPRNATTGYVWILKNPEVYTFVEQINYQYEKGNSKLIGGAGKDVWHFRVRKNYFKAPITFQLNFIYAQPWEFKVAQEAVFNVVTLPS